MNNIDLISEINNQIKILESYEKDSLQRIIKFKLNTKKFNNLKCNISLFWFIKSINKFIIITILQNCYN